jgi:uncharacterized Zn finger protein
MTVGNLPRFDIAALKRVAGAAFARGEAYHRDGRVELLAVEPGRVLAEVSGSEDYHVRLVRKGEAFGGECACPAFEDFGFCKHMVATALAANQSAVEFVPDAGAFGRIRAYLTAKPHDQQFDAAWAMTRKHRVSRTVKEGLARVSEADHPREALEAYAERVDELAKAGGDPAYSEAAGLVARMRRLRAPAEQAAYIAALKERFRRKRNFMKILEGGE